MKSTVITEVGPNSRRADLPAQTHALLSIFGRNALWIWVDRAGLRIATLLAGLLLIGYLGPANYGIYATALSIGSLVNTALDFGLTRYAARTVAAAPWEGRPILAFCLLGTAVSAAIEVATAAAFAWTGHRFLACIFVGLLLTNLEGTASLCSGMLNAEFRSRGIVPGSMIGAIGLICVIALVMWQHLSVFLLLIGVSLKSLAVAGFRLWQLRHHWPRRQDVQKIRRTLGLAWPFFSGSLTQMGYEQAAIVCSGLVISHEAVGWLCAALTIVNIVPQWTYASTDAVLPILTRLFENRRMQEVHDLSHRLLEVLLLLCVPVIVILACFAPEICQLLGSRFAPSALALRIMSCRSLLMVLDGFLGQALLTAANRTADRRNAQAKALLVLACLTLVLGHFWGVAGVGFALLAADTTLVLLYLQILSTMNMKPRLSGLGSAVLGAAAMVLTAAELPRAMPWAAKLAPVLLVYFSILGLVARGKLISAGQTLRQCFPSTS